MKKKEEKKISQKSILIGEKLVFKRRKIKTVGDLVKKNNKSELGKKKEKNRFKIKRIRKANRKREKKRRRRRRYFN